MSKWSFSGPITQNFVKVTHKSNLLPWYFACSISVMSSSIEYQMIRLAPWQYSLQSSEYFLVFRWPYTLSDKLHLRHRMRNAENSSLLLKLHISTQSLWVFCKERLNAPLVFHLCHPSTYICLTKLFSFREHRRRRFLFRLNYTFWSPVKVLLNLPKP